MYHIQLSGEAKAQSVDVLYVKKTSHVGVFVSFVRVCQQSVTVFTFSGKSPAELSFKSLHNIVLLSILSRRPTDLCAEIKFIVFCFMFSLHFYQAMIILQIQKKYKKMLFCLM